MRPLLHHASRSLIANATNVTAKTSSRSFGPVSSGSLSFCVSCQARGVSTAFRGVDGLQLKAVRPRKVCREPFSTSSRWKEDGRGLNPNRNDSALPTSHPRPLQRSEDTAPEHLPSLEHQERLQEAPDASLERQAEASSAPRTSQPNAQSRPSVGTATPTRDNVSDSIARVPDEQLPSHRDRQRWDLSKRFSDIMDDLLPKLAVVTQKVNTYTGTDYSGVAALRREIKEQENLVKARRLAIDTAKQALDTALAHQASSQKEVVALLERKHSWSAGDLERYMALIRSEHVNDQAVREAKESVANAETALEEARTQLEKRERAQYHEEQIWSDTIRRNSTWVTFGLMGVNIFLLLLSLAILEPWRRRRMVREIKNALEAHKVAIGSAPAVAAAVDPTGSSTTQSDSATANLAAVEEEIDKVKSEDTPTQVGMHTAAEPVVNELQNAANESKKDAILVAEITPDGVTYPIHDTAVPGAAPPFAAEADASPPSHIEIAEEVKANRGISGKMSSWRSKTVAIAQDIVSDRIISMRRIDYTTAVLQGAAAGAVITAALIAMWRPT
ncbi:hypothetical protein IQ07DRAFT_639976 [Pyrenochaeta sp. DS3sAY3a]|nr:hypothetical protein IQ07DRAFT_639976 [Pyrenochaeta sp. DS3sAY3a]